MENAFTELTPDRVLDRVEQALHRKCSGLCRPLNSYINRVYEIEFNDGAAAVAKFYRPGRWSRAALEDELTFVAELAADELPVIPPLSAPDGALLHADGQLFFAVYPKKGGRTLEEPVGGDWEQLGRLLARTHNTGARHPPRDRIEIGPRQSLLRQRDYLLEGECIPAEARDAYRAVTDELLAVIEPLFDGVEKIRIHGDCHRANILHRPGEPFWLIDFDDMAVGPATQDLWMLLPGRPRDSLMELDELLEGYETFRPFDRATLRLVEPLRAMRFVHYTAWCARQRADGGFTRLAPGWGHAEHWRREIHELRKQLREIEDACAAPPLW